MQKNVYEHINITNVINQLNIKTMIIAVLSLLLLIVGGFTLGFLESAIIIIFIDVILYAIN